MYCTYMLTLASLKMFVRNRQALFFSIFMPLLIMVIFGAMNFDRQTPLTVGLVAEHPGMAAAAFVQQAKKIPAVTVDQGTLEEELGELKGGNRTAVLVVPDNFLGPLGSKQLKVYVNQERPIEANMAMAVIDRMADKATLMARHVTPLFEIKQESVSVREVRYIEFLLPGVIAMSVMQMSVFSVAFVLPSIGRRGCSSGCWPRPCGRTSL